MVQNYVVHRQNSRVAEQCDVNIQSINASSSRQWVASLCKATRGLLATDIVILNLAQVTRMTLEMPLPLHVTTSRQQEDFSPREIKRASAPPHGGSRRAP
ncbi:hypothetical protein TNCV_2515921 [Trichonephila clavipes]|nr:hypothetical protein TNCV_2515921 [Trichonephila clavipes]